jgi:hypothetical protein
MNCEIDNSCPESRTQSVSVAFDLSVSEEAKIRFSWNRNADNRTGGMQPDIIINRAKGDSNERSPNN